MSFLETDLTLPIARRISELWDSFFTKEFVGSNCLLFARTGKVVTDPAEFLGGRQFFASECLAKTTENPGFFRVQLLLYRSSLSQYPKSGIPMLVMGRTKKR